MSFQASDDEYKTARSGSLSPVIALSPSVRRFRENHQLGTRRLRKLMTHGLLLPEFSTSSQTRTVFEMKKYSNMRDTEERLQRLEIIERLLKLKAEDYKNVKEKDVATLTAMYLELGRGLSDDEFIKEVEEAAAAGQTFEDRTVVITDDSTKTEATKSDATPQNITDQLPRIVLERIPMHLIEGYCEGGLKLLVKNSKITLGRRKTRRDRFPNKN